MCYWLIAIVLLLIIGIDKSINLVTLIACVMVGMLVLNIFVAGRRVGRLQGERRIAGPVFAQSPFSVAWNVVNAPRTVQLGLLVEDDGIDQQRRWFLPRLGRDQEFHFRTELTVPERGAFSWGALKVSSGHPFGLFQRERLLSPAQRIVVLPRLGRVHRGRLRFYLTTAGGFSPRLGPNMRRHPAAQSEFHGLRVFRSGDSPRWIHWRTSARCGELMVREFEEAVTDNLILVVDLSGRPTPRNVEETVSLAASICWEWCRQRGDQLLLAVTGTTPVIVDGVTSQRHALDLLECLAMQQGWEGDGEAALVTHLSARPLPAAPVVILSARPTHLGELISDRLQRPAATIEITGPPNLPFYESPWNP